MTSPMPADNVTGQTADTGGRAFTVRAVVVGLVLGGTVAAAGYFNDWVLWQPFVASDLAPVSAYGLLLAAMLTVNPLLRAARIRPLSAGEWCVILAMLLAACALPGPGLFWGFTNPMVALPRYEPQNPAWQYWHLMDYVPEAMQADGGPDNEVVKKFFEGVGNGRPASWSKIPWYGWVRPLAFWWPLLAMSFIATICLAVVVHVQWSRHERLRYPLAEFASSLIAAGTSPGPGGLFRQRRFQVGFAVAFGLLAINASSAWTMLLWNLEIPQIPLSVDLTPLARQFPRLAEAPYGGLFGLTLWLAPMGLAFLVPTDVSFSIGISSLVWSLVYVLLLELGVDTSFSYLGGGLLPNTAFGGYLAAAAILFYTGRRYYASLLAALVRPASPNTPAPGTLWACRIGLLAAGGMVVLLIRAVDLHWLPALLFVLLTGLIFLIVCRLSVETGLFFLQPMWHAVGVMQGLFGLPALGPHALTALGFLCTIVTIDPRVCLLPLAANALRVGDSARLAPARLGWAMAAAVLLALVAGTIGTLYTQYSFGASGLYIWSDFCVQYPFEVLLKELPSLPPGDLIEKGQFAFSRIAPAKHFLPAAGVGFVGVLVLSALRLRYPRWPIHPVLFLVAGTLPSTLFWGSFLAGWLAKTAVLRFGGGAYERAKQFFIGLIAGEFAIGLLSMLAGLTYYLATGLKGPAFRVHP